LRAPEVLERWTERLELAAAPFIACLGEAEPGTEIRVRSRSKQIVELLCRNLAVMKDFPEQPRTENLASMNRDNGDASILMAKEVMAAAHANDLETKTSQSGHQLLAGDPRLAGSHATRTR